ncbi:MAG: SDR family oxidoreductase [Rhodospirillales bacterium]|jgi:NAD(P)-dependent dehydrogenase (short-subunit alcohol dehydrogenase family)|nr:SDR family oxidoreductase [Rhodospirillales bacterium]|tara:strand:- start:46 stop:768 length:723 start_codon:yes stop_codon:yes gene_type:complete
MPSLLITGANRGIGLEFTRQYLSDGWRIYACCRAPEKADTLKKLAEGFSDQLSIYRMDVRNGDEVSAVAEALNGIPIDILINNAGIVDSYGRGVFEGKDDPDLKNYDLDLWLEIFNTNVVSQGRITGEFADNVAASERKMVVMISSGLASINNTWQAGRYAYRTSKAALNMLTRGVGAWLEPRGVTVVTIAPGWTRTELGGPNAHYSVEESISGMRKVLDGLTIKDTGSYWNFNGEQLPW